MSNTRGFTLLELIVATAILAAAVVGLMSGITGSTHNAARLRDADRVTLAAREQMNELLSDLSLPRDTQIAGTFDPALMGGLNSGWQATLATAERAPGGNGMLALDRIRLDVWWNAGANKRTITLEGFRRRPLLKGEGGQ